MMLKQLIRYNNTSALEATWEDVTGTIVKCQAYSNAQMDMLRQDLGEQDSQTYADLISSIEATYIPPEPIPLKERQDLVWEKIKAERDRRKTLGVKAGGHWFHSDTDSRVQWLGLKDTARDLFEIPGNSFGTFIELLGQIVSWKTLTGDFVQVTIQLALDVTQATKELDAILFKVAETHRFAMQASVNPEEYDYSGNWPTTIDDELNVAEDNTMESQEP